jgi:hypothetical protein
LEISGQRILNRNGEKMAQGIGKVEIMGGREEKSDKAWEKERAKWIVCRIPKRENRHKLNNIK